MLAFGLNDALETELREHAQSDLIREKIRQKLEMPTLHHTVRTNLTHAIDLPISHNILDFEHASPHLVALVLEAVCVTKLLLATLVVELWATDRRPLRSPCRPPVPPEGECRFANGTEPDYIFATGTKVLVGLPGLCDSLSDEQTEA